MSLPGAAPVVRRASAADVPALAGVLARAFLEDPVAAWAFRPGDLRLGALERFQGTRLRQLLAGGEVWTTADLACAALWAAPGHWRSTPREEAQIASSFLRPRLIVRLPLAAVGWQLLERRHPSATARSRGVYG